MNILLISLDPEFAQPGRACTSGTYRCHLEYAKLLSRYFIITRTPRSPQFRTQSPAENMHIYPSLSLSKASFIRDAFRIGSRICQNNGIDLISCQDPFSTALVGYLLKRRFGIPLNINILADIINNPYFTSERRLNYLLNIWAGWMIRLADTVRVSTSLEKEKLSLRGVAVEKIQHVPFFVDTPASPETDRGIRSSILGSRFDKIILSASRLVKQKNIGALLRAAVYTVKEYPRSVFLIIGAGPERKRLEKMAFKLGIAEFVRFYGPVPYGDIRRYYLAADIFVVTSRYEGTCRSMLDAALAKKPVISTPHAGASDALVDGHTGFTVGFDDYIGLAEKILYLLRNAGIAAKMGDNAHSFVSGQFKKEEILKKYYHMWEAARSKCTTC